MHDRLYGLLALILARGSGGVDTDLADELAKQMSVEMAVQSSEDRCVLCLRILETRKSVLGFLVPKKGPESPP